MTTTVSLGIPVRSYLLVERAQPMTKTEQGIEIPTEAIKQTHMGTVIEIGHEVGDILPQIKQGSRIMWMYDLPLDAEVIHDGPEDIVILDARDVALILDT